MTTDTVPKHTHHASPVHEPPAAIRATGIIVVLIVVLAILAIAFALPAARSKPNDVPIGAAGPQAASGQVAQVLEQHAPGAFAITYYPGEAALRDAIRNRDVYGGISFGQDGRSLLIATGGSPMVAQMLTQVGTGIAQQAGTPLHTEDLAPPPAADPRGAGLAASALPITLAGLLPAIALALRSASARVDTLAIAVVFAAVVALPSPRCCATCSAPSTRTSGRRGGLTLGAPAAGPSMLGLARCSAGSGLRLAGCWRCCSATHCRAWTARQRCCRAAGTPRAAAAGREPRRCCGRRLFDGAGATTAIVVLTCWRSPDRTDRARRCSPA